MVHKTLLIFLGGGLGSCLRFFITHLLSKTVDTTFPVGILTVNVLGCFLMGTTLGAFNSFATHSLWNSFIIIGFLGGFTTFSSFTNDCIHLLQRGDFGWGALYLIASVLLSIIFLMLGIWFVKYFYLIKFS
ncbi:MAG: fluoride efflux transporter CrcB [Pseudomonadota bacterium]